MSELTQLLRAASHPLTGGARDYDPLMRVVGNARLVLLGEATHGTPEFYRARAQITQRLINEKGFCAVLAEADWPDAWRVNRYVQGAPTTPMRWTRWRALRVFRSGCGAMPMCSTLSAGCAATTTARVRPDARSGFMG